MKLDALSLLYLFGGLQALTLIIGINLNKPLSTDVKKILTLLLSAILVVMVYYVVIRTNNQVIYPYVDSLGTVGWMAICPLYYLLHCSLLKAKRKLGLRHLLLFPISIIFLLEGWLMTLGMPVGLYGLLNEPQLFLDLWVAFFFGTGIYFIVKSILLLRKTEGMSFRKEFLGFSYVILGTMVIFALIYLFIREHYDYAFEYSLIALFEILIFAFIYRMFKLSSFDKLFNDAKYVNQAGDTTQLAQMAQQLEQTMINAQPFLDRKLTLVKLSKMTDISPNDLSHLFSVHYKSNFYEYINQKRLSHFEKLLLNPDYRQFKIMAIAEMSGFNSKTPFYNTFKEKYKMTPSEYLKGGPSHF